MGRRLRAAEARIYLQVSALLVASLAVGVTVWVERQPSSAAPNLAMGVGFAVAFFAARLLTVRLPQGDEVCITLMVGLVGLAFVDIPMLVMASLVAGFADSAARFSGSSRQQFNARARDVLRSITILALLSPWQLVLHPLVMGSDRGDLVVIVAILGGASFAAVDILTAATVQSAFGEMSTTQSLASLFRSLSTVLVVHVSMAAVVLRLQGVAGSWPFPVAILLTLILQNSFNLYIRIRRAYAETIEALAHAAELDRPHDSGHARRVADLSVKIGRRLGLTSHELERLGYAALLHDIGRMGTADEDPEEDYARRGAEIAGSIPFLEGVAPLILWDVEGSGPSASPPLGWSIVRTCSQYDRLRSEIGAEAALTAMATMPIGVDGRVVDVLAETVRSKQILGGAPL